MIPSRIVGVFVVTALVVLGCRDDSNRITGPVELPEGSTFDVLPGNGGMLPEVITQVSGSTETHLITFELPLGTNNVDIEGSPWGVWFGDSDVSVPDPPTGNVAFRAFLEGVGNVFNLPSGNNYAGQWNGIRLSFLYFDPPVRRVSFAYASREGMGRSTQPPEAFYFRVKDLNGFTVLFDSIRSNNPGGPSVDLVNWDTITVLHSSGEDRITEIFFNGSMIIDDLEISREAAPAIECDTVTRGQATTCRVLPVVLATLDSVTGWQFDADVDNAVVPIPGPALGTEWSGVAVAPGSATATGWLNDSPSPLSGTLEVDPRPVSDWQWGGADWQFVTGGGFVPCSTPSLFPKLVYSTGPGGAVIRLGTNIRATSCLGGQIEPPPQQLPASPVTFGEITDQGPNQGLWYVTSAAYSMNTGSLINPSIMVGYPPDPLHKKDKKDCPAGWTSANFYDFNVTCHGIDVDALLNGIYFHEGIGTTGINGHESQRRIAAAQPAFDPETLAETLVRESEAKLLTAVPESMQSLDDDITLAADPNHIIVQGNFNGMYYVLYTNGQFKLEVLEDDNP